MTLARFLAGIPLGLIALVPIGFLAQAARRVLLPGWFGLEARLVDIVLGLVAVTVVSEALGTVGWFAPAQLAVALALIGGTGWLALRSRLPPAAEAVVEDASARGSSTAGSDLVRRSRSACATVGIALVVGSWLARSLGSIARGMTTVDTLWYHLPVAVRFAQTGSTTSVQYLDTEPVTAFFPATSSLFHGIGMLLFRTDLVSTVVNLGWLALALAAAWCAGRRFGVAPATALGAALLLGTPGMVATQPGGAYDDVAGIALMLVALAITLRGADEGRSTAQDAIAALAAGLALGMKFTFVLPAVALCLGLVVTAPRGVRLRRALAMFVAAAVSGGYWYIRNTVAAGSPLPSFSFHLGPLTLPSVKGATPTSTVAKFLFDGQAWKDNFLPGLRGSLGPVWIAVVLFSLAGMVVAIAQRSQPRLRMLGIVGVLSVAAYLVTPQYLLGGFGRPHFFGANLRYASPALAIGLLLFPIVVPRWRDWVLGALAGAVVVTQFDPTSWPTSVHWAVFQDRIGGADAARAVAVLAGAAILAVGGYAAMQRVPARRVRACVAAVLVPVTVLVGLAFVHGTYLAHRYTNTAPFPTVFAWAREVHGARVAVVGGYMQAQYPMAGLDLTDYEQFAGVRSSDGGWRPVRNCGEWVKFLEAGHYDFVVVGPGDGFTEWTAAQPDARMIRAQTAGNNVPVIRIFSLDRRRTQRTCA